MLDHFRSIALLTIALLTVAATSAHAQIIDRIEIKRAGDEAEIRIAFVTQIQYLRDASLKNGDIRVYFNLLGVDALDPRLVPENKEAPPSDIAPHFSVAYPELDSSLSVSFGKVVEYRVRPGKDGRSISIFTPALKPKNEPESKVAPAVAAPTAAVAAAAGAAATSAIAAPATVVGGVLPSGAVTSRQAEPVTTPPASAAQPQATPTPSQPEAVIPPASPPPVVTELAQPEGALRPVEDIEREAQQLIGSARYALQNDRPEIAIATLNQLLNLPPNKQSQSAQALIGEAWEKHGEPDKARAEYELYLKLYPDAADTKQVKERLARLPAKGAAKPVQEAVAKPKYTEEKMTVYGGLSQYFYKGMSHTDSLIMSGATTTATSLDRQDQSQLLSMLDVTGRKRTETVDTRLVMRDSYNANFLPGQMSYNRLDTAYIEQSSREHTYTYRLGRQTGTGGGVPGRFDGAFAGYSFNSVVRVNGVVGVPTEFTSGGPSAGTSKSFTGMSVDITRAPEQLSGSAYLIQQKVNGVVDRRAVGGDVRYADAQRNLMGLAEYDTIFREMNLAMLQGNWNMPDSTNYNMLLDRRRSPPLQLSNALMGQPVQSVADLLQSGVAMDTVIADAKALSPISNMFAIGMNRPYSSRLRVGGDFRVSNVSGTGATIQTNQPATDGSGNTYTYSVQATGNGLFQENDFGVVSAAYTSSKNYKGQSLSFTQVETFRQYWRLDMLLMLYSQADNLGTNQTQIRPSLKLNYRVKDNVNLEGEIGVENIHVSSAIQDDRTQRRYFYLGYRWDFH
ncbi:MAG: hypothetical protein HY016_00350 [Nitrosomonadales bacterium]|nr:hypothetical protein [Nitrosomonadales bacterium]